MLTKPFKSKVIMKVRTDHLQTGMYVAASIPPQESSVIYCCLIS